jgi:hypothetical protein
VGSLSGFVTEASTGNAIPGITITLSWTDSQNQVHTLSTTTAADGSFSFANLAAGTYTLTEVLPSVFQDAQNTAGSLGGTPNVASNQITGIVVSGGANGTGYLFQDFSVGA